MAIPSALRNCRRFSSTLQRVQAFYPGNFKCIRCCKWKTTGCLKLDFFRFRKKGILTRMEKIAPHLLNVFILTPQLPTLSKNPANVSLGKIPVRLFRPCNSHYSSPALTNQKPLVSTLQSLCLGCTCPSFLAKI